MKWHIYYKSKDNPIRWEGKILEFDTRESAEDFKGSLMILGDWERLFIEQDVALYGFDYLNATGYICDFDLKTDKAQLLKVNN